MYSSRDSIRSNEHRGSEADPGRDTLTATRRDTEDTLYSCAGLMRGSRYGIHAPQV